MYTNGKNRAMLADNILPYLKNISQTWVRCSYCGRTVMYSQKTRHTILFHTNVDGGLIIDF